MKSLGYFSFSLLSIHFKKCVCVCVRVYVCECVCTHFTIWEWVGSTFEVSFLVLDLMSMTEYP